jgi:hypothetical protein
MAVRLFNRHTHPLFVDLRGGETLVVPPRETSRALLEELLYDNPNLREWEANGWLVRLPARFAELEARPGADAPADEGEDEARDEAQDEAQTDDDESTPRRPRKPAARTPRKRT